MPDTITIEQMKLGERDAVLAFLATAYADDPRHSDARYWEWHFPGSPFCNAADLPIWLAKSEGRIVGQLAATPVEFNVNGKAERAVWILDLIVDPAFRRRGIAKRLALASKEYCPYVLGVNTSAQHSTELLAGLGWNIFTKIPRYHKLLFPANGLRETATIGVMREAINAAFAPLRPNIHKLQDRAKNVRSIDAFDLSFDELWTAAKSQWPCSVSRNAAMLNWQFRMQPGKQFEILGYFDGDRLKGYAVLFCRRPGPNGVISKAAISDICYHPDGSVETVEALIAASMKVAIERRVGGLVTDVIDPLMTERLKDAGFRRVPSTLQLLANVPEAEQATVCDAANWFLTRGDSDISIFEDPNIVE